MDKLLTDKQIMTGGFLQKWQEEVLLSKIKFKVVVASRQIGKSLTLKAIILKESLENDGIEILVLASTLKQTRAIHFRPMVLSNDPIFDKHLVKEVNKTDLSIELVNGSRVTFASAESIDSLRGRTADIVIIDESGHCQLDEVLEVLQPVVSARQGSIILVGTPSGKAHPFYQYHQKGLLGSPFFTKGFRSWTIPISHPDVVVPNKEARIKQAMSVLSPFQYAQEYETSFEAQEGLVYKYFDSIRNQSDKNFEQEKPLFIGLDFNVGVMNAIVTQIYKGSDGEFVHCIDEIRLRNTNTEEMSKEIKRRYGSMTKFPITIYPDASGNASKTSAGVSVTDITILRNNGFNVKVSGKNPLIQDRVNNMNNMICSASGVCRLLVNPRCKYLIQALTSQTYDDNGKPVKGIGEADLSGPNDAIGYLIHSRYNMKSGFTFQHQ